MTRTSDSAILARGGPALEPQELEQQRGLGRATDVAIRLGSLALLVGWCFVIVSPFLLPIAWGAIIAVALHGPFVAPSPSRSGRCCCCRSTTCSSRC